MYWIARLIIVLFLVLIGLEFWNDYRLSKESLRIFGRVTSIEKGRHGYKYIYYCYMVNDIEYCDRLNIVGDKKCEYYPNQCTGKIVYIEYLEVDPSVHKASIDW